MSTQAASLKISDGQCLQRTLVYRLQQGKVHNYE
jgi:hypothetical protein